MISGLMTHRFRSILLALGCALSLAGAPIAGARAQSVAPTAAPDGSALTGASAKAALPEISPDIAARLDKAKAALDRAAAAIKRDNLDDATLASIRTELEPAEQAAQSAADDLQPRLDALKARLDQLGAKPDDKAAPETAAVAAERAENEKLRSETDELVKRGRLLALQIGQVDATIIARRRALFIKDLFQHSRSILAPGLWRNVAREAPIDLSAAGQATREYGAFAADKLTGGRSFVFAALLLLIGLLNVPLSRLVRAILSREPRVEEPSALDKAKGAAWVAIVVSILPLATIAAFFALGDAFDLNSQRLQPLRIALIAGVARIALAAGLARGLLAPSRPPWRLMDVEDETAARLSRLAVSVAVLMSLFKLLDAVNEIIGASVPVIAATQGVGACAVALLVGVTLLAIGGVEDEDARATRSKRWLSAGRLGAMLVSLIVLGAAIFGYVRFASFLVDQLAWAVAAGTMLRILSPLITHSIEESFQPNTRTGRVLTSSVGLTRDGVTQLGVLLSGLSRLVTYVFIFFLIAAPLGIGSADLETALGRAFNGIAIGDVQFSPRSILGALAIFGLGWMATAGLQRWVAEKLLPTMQIDAGLRNAIRTSLGYVGVILATVLSLSHVGLGFEKLTIVAGALSVGIGFGLQSIVSNFVSGLIVLWEGAVRVGDWIVVGTDQGHVRRINVRSTEIETFERSTLIIPNSNLITGVVKNWVRTDRVGRITIPVALHPGADPFVVREIMIAAAKGHEQVNKIPAPNVNFVSMDPTSLKFDLICFVDDVEASARVKSDLHFEIFKQFKEAGVALATSTDVRVTLESLGAQLAGLPGQKG